MTHEERSKVVQFMAALNRVEQRFRADRDCSIAAAEQHLDFLQNLVTVNGGFITVAESNKSLCGFLTGVVDSEDGYYVLPQKRKFGHVTDIYILEDKRRHGLGRLLLEDAEARFLKTGIEAVRITGLTANYNAISAYEACGFKPLEITLEKKL